MIQAALKGLQCCLSGGKWKFGGGEEVGSVLAALKVPNCNTSADFSIALPAQTNMSVIYCGNDLDMLLCRGSCSRELQV